MKILMIAPNPFFVDRGFSVRVYDQIKGLQEKGHKVIVVSYGCGRDINGVDIKRIPRLPGYDEESIGASYSRLYLDILLLFFAFFICLKLKPHIIHAHLHEGAVIGIIIGKIFKIPVLLDAQGSLTGELKDRGAIKNKIFLQIIRKIENIIYKYVDAIVVSSPKMKEILEKDFKLKPSKVNLLLDGVDTKMFNPERDNGINKELLGLPQNKKIVIYMGTLHEYYGINCLLESIKFIISKYDKVHFLIIGGPNVKKYKMLAIKLGIDDVVTFTGRIRYEDTPKYLKIADIAVAPKLGGTEANLKLGYYMACGLPVVCFDTEINRKVLEEYGVYANIGDPVSLGHKIIELLEDENKRKKISIGVRERVVKNYSIEYITGELITLYIRLTNERKK